MSQKWQVSTAGPIPRTKACLDPYGQKAKWALHKFCKGQTIRAEVTDIDRHGRTVAKCYLPDGRDLSAEMVKLGMAIAWPKYSDKKYAHLETPDARKKLFL
ncbi:MAG: thermonuclease family protein, partial [Sulfitobacter sp.]